MESLTTKVIEAFFMFAWTIWHYSNMWLFKLKANDQYSLAMEATKFMELYKETMQKT